MGKYIIDIPDDMIISGELSTLAIKVQFGNIRPFVLGTGLKLMPYDDAEQRGVEKAWAFVRWIWEEADMIEVFHTNFGDVLAMGYQDVRAKADEWKKQKEEDAEIKVGDEVKLVKSNEKAVVVKTEIDAIHGLSKYDEKLVQAYWLKSEVTKTGRYFPEVAELLKKMEGE